MDRLAGKVVLVTGGGGGLGAAVALRCAAEGAAVVIGDLDEAAGLRVADEISAMGGRALGRGLDGRDEASLAALARATTDAFGGLDGAVFCAADMSLVPRDHDALTIDLAVFDAVIAGHLRSQLLSTRAILPLLLERGGGALVFMSSQAAFSPAPMLAGYAAAKGGVNALMRHVAFTWGKQGVRANALAPGFVMTERNALDHGREAVEARRAASLARTPSTHAGEAGDVAAMAALLISDEGAWINGQVLNLDGGGTMR